MFKIFFLKSVVCFILFSSVSSKSQDNKITSEIFNRLVGTWKNSFKSVLDSSINGSGFDSNRTVMNGKFLIMEGITFFENDTTKGFTILGFDEMSKKFNFFHIEDSYDHFLISKGEFDTSDSSISFIFEHPINSFDLIIVTKLKIKFVSEDQYNTEIFTINKGGDEILTIKGVNIRE